MALAEEATRDSLTGLYNRRYFNDTLADHIDAAARYKRDLALIFFDLDQFKQINDTRGHEAGDAALCRFANHLKSTARAADIACRVGGDEFALILPETNAKQAKKLITRLQKETASSAKESEGAIPPATAGIAALPCDNLVSSADTALQKNKRLVRPN